jgi:hypothetical protein
MPYDKVGQVTYLFCLNVVDVASRYKVSIPIGAYSVKDRKGILTSATIARALKKKYDDPECLLIWPEKFLTDKGPEFRGDCEKLMRDHSVKIQKAKTKRAMGIVESYNKTLREKCGFPQDASDQLLPITERSRAWVKNLQLFVEDINNSITRQIGMAPAVAIEKKVLLLKLLNPVMGLWDMMKSD